MQLAELKYNKIGLFRVNTIIFTTGQDPREMENKGIDSESSPTEYDTIQCDMISCHVMGLDMDCVSGADLKGVNVLFKSSEVWVR